MMTKDDGVLNAIRDKMGWIDKKRVKIQHDGATPHTGDDNELYLNHAGTDYGWEISFETQPSNSPDLNKNDLCFFHSLQRDADRLRYRHQNTEEMLEAVKNAYEQYNPDILERIDALQYEIWRQILGDNGGNHYKIPHSGIRNRQNDGLDVVDRKVPKELMLKAEKMHKQLAKELAKEKREREQAKLKRKKLRKKKRKSAN
jgi:hypothetical protein